jgi:hypothetical protein
MSSIAGPDGPAIVEEHVGGGSGIFDVVNFKVENPQKIGNGLVRIIVTKIVSTVRHGKRFERWRCDKA